MSRRKCGLQSAERSITSGSHVPGTTHTPLCAPRGTTSIRCRAMSRARASCAWTSGTGRLPAPRLESPGRRGRRGLDASESAPAARPSMRGAEGGGCRFHEPPCLFADSGPVIRAILRHTCRGTVLFHHRQGWLFVIFRTTSAASGPKCVILLAHELSHRGLSKRVVGDAVPLVDPLP